MAYVAEKNIVNQVENLILETQDAEKKHELDIQKVHPDLVGSAINLLHYCEIRKHDLTYLQQELGKLGLTRLARAEEHVLNSLKQVRHLLKIITENNRSTTTDPFKSDVTNNLLTKNTNHVLGAAMAHRRARIMVTMPSEASSNHLMVANMIRSGMNIARINCAHDGPEVWTAMIRNIRQASTDLQKPVKIIMDLAGPKVRTGPIENAPQVFKIKPKKNEWGKVIAPAQIPCAINTQICHPGEICITTLAPPKALNKRTYTLKDTRGKKRKLSFSFQDDTLIANFDQTSYLTPGQKLVGPKDCPEVVIDQIPTDDGCLVLNEGDLLRLTKEETLGKNATTGELAVISCTLTEAIDALKLGHKIYFDDGKIKGNVIESKATEVLIEITQTNKPNCKLKAEKGINLPDSTLPVRGLTSKDLEDLRFVIKNADGVSLSFLSDRTDVSDVLSQLKILEAPSSFSIILKIENKKAFTHLRDLLLEAMRWPSVGVMIARGDLAIETGWDNIGRIQKEIVKMASAAHLPVIWATQVLDNLAKNGFPLRSEVTDAASSIRAECVMLNKGPYILKAIEFLDKLLADTEVFQQKNYALLPKMMELK